MAMYYGAFRKDEMQAALVGLKKAIAKYDGHIQIGVLGARTLFRVLSDMGETELAYRMITRPDYPSFANHVLTGATTLYEIFRKPSEEFPYTSDMFACGSHNARSLNHHFWGDVSGARRHQNKRGADEAHRRRNRPQNRKRAGFRPRNARL